MSTDDLIKKEMWENMQPPCGAAVMCGQCGGSYRYNCGCVRSEFMNRVSVQDIADFKLRRRQQCIAQAAAIDDHYRLAVLELERQYAAKKKALE